jgi:hypothetical protein
VQEQKPLIQIEQQVFASAANTHHEATLQTLGRHAQRPSQRLAHVQGQNASRLNAVGKTAACDFNFWEFGHA